MPQRGRRRGRGRGGDGAWTWGAVGNSLGETRGRGRSGRGGGRGGRGDGRSREPFVSGHDTQRHSHLVKSEGHLKNRRGRGRGRGGGPRGRGGRHIEDRRKFQQDVPVEQVNEEGIARHCEVAGAHTGAIAAITMCEQGIYTASFDKSLKRWKPVRQDNGRMELVTDLTLPLPQSCCSLLFSGGWLFCGLWDGSIRAYSQDGTEVTLQGHNRRVTSLLVHQNVLISGSADREVRLWQMNPTTNGFSCTHTIKESLPGAIVRLHVLGDNLFIGGTSGIAICNLQSLTVTKILPPTKSVADFLEFTGHLIVAYTDGGIRIVDGEGTLKSDMQPLAAGPILSLGGLESGPRVLVGHARGQISTITLPNFEFKTQFQALDGNKVESIKCAGHDGIFLLGAQNGTLQLWQRVGA